MGVNRVFICVLFVSAHYLISVSSWDETCKGRPMRHQDYSDISEKNIKECLQEAGVKNYKDLPKNKGCFGKCAYEKQGLIDENGKILIEKTVTLVQAVMPEEVKDEFAVKLKKCLDDFAHKTIYTEESCDSYVPMLSCIHHAFEEVCEHN